MLGLVSLCRILEVSNCVCVEVCLHKANLTNKRISAVVKCENLGSATDTQVMTTNQNQQVFGLSFTHSAHLVFLHLVMLYLKCIINIQRWQQIRRNRRALLRSISASFSLITTLRRRDTWILSSYPNFSAICWSLQALMCVSRISRCVRQ